MELKCDKCKRPATISNSQYFADKWLCTRHAKESIKQGRIERKKRKL